MCNDSAEGKVIDSRARRIAAKHYGDHDPYVWPESHNRIMLVLHHEEHGYDCRCYPSIDWMFTQYLTNADDDDETWSSWEPVAVWDLSVSPPACVGQREAERVDAA